MKSCPNRHSNSFIVSIPVIGSEPDEGVILHIQLLQLLYNIPYGIVQLCQTVTKLAPIGCALVSLRRKLRMMDLQEIDS